MKGMHFSLRADRGDPPGNGEALARSANSMRSLRGAQ